MIKNVAIIDYGLGNILSTQQSFLKVANDNNIKANVIITNQPRKITESTHIVLPGQGAFETCMKGLSSIPYMINELTKSVIKNKTPFLGICIGMQLLANISYENGKHKGLGWIDGQIKKLPTNNLKLPHMGWNEIELKKDCFLFSNIKNKSHVYFIHSYEFMTKEKDCVLATTNYGNSIIASVEKENIVGTQFHPEKSQKNGLIILENFLKWKI